MLPYCCQSPDTNAIGPLVFTGFAGKSKSRRADSNRLPLLPLLQLRVIIRVLQEVAEWCKIPANQHDSTYSSPVLHPAPRSQWYQSGIKRLPVIRVKRYGKSVDDASRRFLCKPHPRPGYAPLARLFLARIFSGSPLR
jgi:hypothetical protein